MYIIKMGKYTCYEKNVFGLNTKMPDNNSEGPIQESYRSRWLTRTMSYCRKKMDVCA